MSFSEYMLFLTVAFYCVAMFWWIVSGTGAIVLTATGAALIIHIASTYSSMGRVIMATSAMGPTPILSKEEEDELTPAQLSSLLLDDTRLARRAKIPVNRQYRMNYQETVLHEGSKRFTYAESVRVRHAAVLEEDGGVVEDVGE